MSGPASPSDSHGSAGPHARAAAPSTVDELGAWLRERNVRVVHVLHSDLFGRARAKRFPVSARSKLSDGIGYSKTSLVESLDGEMLDGPRFPAALGHPDLHAVADPSTARCVPWQPATAWILADLVEHRQPSPLCARSALRRVCERFRGRALEPMVAAEPEFYLLNADRTPYADASRAASYSTGVGVDPAGALDAMHRTLIDLDIDVGAATSEYSAGQFEINLDHGPPIAAADHAFLFKEAAKVLAERAGLHATFMAKPFAGAEGSSLHLHLSLWREGANAFALADGDLSPLCRSFIAGLIAHAPALTAFASPTVNSYKRLQPGGIVATEATWGHDSRLTYVRIPQERRSATRVELRAGDASANPYLLVAAALAAGLDGVERDLEPGPPGEHRQPLPRTLESALGELQADGVLIEALGGELVETYAALKRLECARFAATVTEWEWLQYGHRA